MYFRDVVKKTREAQREEGRHAGDSRSTPARVVLSLPPFVSMSVSYCARAVANLLEDTIRIRNFRLVVRQAPLAPGRARAGGANGCREGGKTAMELVALTFWWLLFVSCLFSDLRVRKFASIFLSFLHVQNRLHVYTDLNLTSMALKTNKNRTPLQGRPWPRKFYFPQPFSVRRPFPLGRRDEALKLYLHGIPWSYFPY